MGENESRSNEQKQSEIKKEKRLNFILKVVSVLCAFMLWLYVAGTDSKSYKKEISSVPVSIFTDENLSVIQGSGATVNVTVSGTKSAINNIKSDNITAYVDLSDVGSAGRYTRNVDVTVSGAEGVSIVSKTPENLSVYLDKTTSMSVPVEIKVYGQLLSEDYEVGMPTASVNEITVSGPEAELLGIRCALAEVELDGTSYLTKSLKVSATLRLVDADGNDINASYVSIKGDTHTEVYIPVYLTKSVPLYADYKYGYYNDDNVKVTIDPENVRIKGLAETVDGISHIKLLTIDEKNVKSPTAKLTAPVNLPNGVSSADGVDSASVTVSNVGTHTKTVAVTEFNIINPENYDVKIITDYLLLYLRGEAEDIDAINSSDVTVNVDISNIGAVTGTVQVPVTVSIPAQYEGRVYELDSYTVSVMFAGQ